MTTNGNSRLLADIGGTSVRFALQSGTGAVRDIKVLATGDYPGIVEAAEAYFARVGRPHDLRHAAFDIACAVGGDWVKMTNTPWRFSIEETRRSLDLDRLLVVNDFVAVAHALPHIPADDVLQVGGGTGAPRAVLALLGPGTGLGTSGLVPSGDGWSVLEAEGGHVTMAPATDRESDILTWLRRRYGHVSAERVVSGQGLVNLYAAIAALEGQPAGPLEPADITERWAAGLCPLCHEAVETFCAMLGTLAGNIALTLGARGGVYIAGGIVPRLGDAFITSGFRHAFEKKGRFTGYLAAIPVFVILSKHPAFIGLRWLLDRPPQVLDPSESAMPEPR